MAVVKEYKLEGGPVIRINDAAYIDKTPEEIGKVKENISRVAGQLLYKQYETKLQEGLL